MNIILLSPDEITNGFCTLSDHRHQHIRKILKGVAGDTIRCGIIDGSAGTGLIISSDQAVTVLKISCTSAPPPPLPLRLVVAVPRPKTLKKVIHCATVMGVKHIDFIRTWKVDKSYCDSPLLTQRGAREDLLLGLEQAGDTILPAVNYHPLFRPFTEDLLPTMAQGTRMLVCHPYTDAELPKNSSGPITLVIGPEGGFTDYEIESLCSAGGETVTMGPRILRVEQAIPAALGRLF